MMKKILITAIGFSIVGCAGMKLPDYTQVKSSPYYAECREFAMGVYKNDGYSKLGNTVILSMDDAKARYIVTGCVVAMGKNNIEEVKSDLSSKGVSFGMVSGACYNAACKVDTEQQMKAYTLGSYYAATKKFPDQMKAEF
ncbi:hypothetical protein IFW03_002901 [Salmonella enterica]|nr:hypothetical protein [Salmonella enterica]